MVSEPPLTAKSSVCAGLTMISWSESNGPRANVGVIPSPPRRERRARQRRQAAVGVPRDTRRSRCRPGRCSRHRRRSGRPDRRPPRDGSSARPRPGAIRTAAGGVAPAIGCRGVAAPAVASRSARRAPIVGRTSRSVLLGIVGRPARRTATASRSPACRSSRRRRRPRFLTTGFGDDRAAVILRRGALDPVADVVREAGAGQVLVGLEPRGEPSQGASSGAAICADSGGRTEQ